MQDIKVSEDNSIYTIQYEGEASMDFVNQISNYCKDLFEEKEVKALIFDFEKIDYIDSMAIGVLINLFKLLKKKDNKLFIYKPNELIKGVLNSTGMDKIIGIADSMSEIKEMAMAPK